MPQFFVDFFDRFILAYSRIFEGLLDDRLLSNIQGFDVVIVLASIGFVLFFLRAQILGSFGIFSKSKTEHQRHDRVMHYIETVGDEDEGEDSDGTIDRK